MSSATLKVTDDNFEETVLKSDKPVFVDFWAEWCPPCKRIGPLVEELAGDFDGRAVVAKVEMENAPNVASQYGVTSIPALFVFKGGEVVEQQTGAVPKSVMTEMLEKHV